MKTSIRYLPILLVLLTTASQQLSSAFAQGTAFTYQGQLQNNGSPANGSYDLQFILFNTSQFGFPAAPILTNTAVNVNNGLFTTTLDFGSGIFIGTNYWLDISVRTNGNGAFNELSPRQELTPTPYAVFANTASNVSGTVSAAQLSGAVASANLSGTYGNAMTLNNAGNSFSGNGSGLTSLNAAQLSSIGNANGGTNNFFVGPSGNSTTIGPDNTSVGQDALHNNTTGSANTAIGFLALSNNTTGYDNTAYGAEALYYNTTGYENTANGLGALFGNQNGYQNTANGAGALYYNTNGYENTATGEKALYKNSSGDANTANGYLALELNTTGSANTADGAGALAANNGNYNTADGFQALINNPGGSNNIALGYNAGYGFSANESSNIDIGNNGNPGDQNIIRIGSGQTLTYLAGIIIGNGLGLTNLSASQLVGAGAGNVFIGPAGNPAMNGTDNTADGYQAFFSDVTGDFNTADGYQALYSNTGSSDYSTGNYNTAGGYQALYKNTLGDANTAYGGSALYFNASGNNNTACGAFALYNLGSTGAGGTNNIALGYEAGNNFYLNESGNIDIGNSGVPSENNTIRIGTPGIQTQTYLAGVINGNGSGLANLTAANLTGTLPAISGASLTSLPANSALLGASQIFTGANTFTSTMTVTTPGAVNSLNVYGTQTGGWPNPVALLENKSTAATASPALRVVCDGGTNLDGALSVSVSTGNTGLIAEFGNSTAFVVRITNNGSIFAAGNVYASGMLLISDRNAKEHFKPLDNQAVLAKVAALPLTQWNYKQDQTDVQHIGPMAQDFHSAFQLDGADDKHISVVDEGGVALAAIQGLNDKVEGRSRKAEGQIEELKSENAELKEQNDSLAARLNELEAVVRSLAEKK